jgi:sec-independent protein translocase protein TatA
LQPWHIILLVVVLIALFGAKKLPDAAKGIGHSLRIFKAEAKAMKDEGKEAYDGKNEGKNEGTNGGDGKQGHELANAPAAGQLEAPAQPQGQPQYYQPQQYQQAPGGPAGRATPQSVSGSLGKYPSGGYDNLADRDGQNGHGATHAQR